jgi:deoxyribonuclease V
MIKIPADAAEAIAIQQQLAAKVSLRNDFGAVRIIAGVDCSLDIETERSFAVIVRLEAESLQAIDVYRAEMPVTFPYISGLLSFREIPVILKALEKLPELPDLLMVDGQGVAHPRRLGIAAHLGILTNLPAIGVAKSRLCGSYSEPGPEKGDTAWLMHRKERIGTVLRSKPKCNPLFVSPGHRIDHDTAAAITQRCLTRYRLPEPTRLADKESKLKHHWEEPS